VLCVLGACAWLSQAQAPVVQPGPEDFDPKNIKKSRISKALEDSQFFREIFKLEMKYNSKPSLINKGMNLLVVAQK